MCRQGWILSDLGAPAHSLESSSWMLLAWLPVMRKDWPGRGRFSHLVIITFAFPPFFSKTQEELDMKPVPRDKYSCFSPQETDCSCKKSVSIF